MGTYMIPVLRDGHKLVLMVNSDIRIKRSISYAHRHTSELIMLLLFWVRLQFNIFFAAATSIVGDDKSSCRIYIF